MQTKLISDGEVADDGRPLAVSGDGRRKMDNLPVVQTFYLLAGPQGDQIGVTVAMNASRRRLSATATSNW
ncbi:MAG: hypothetical protein U0792_11460 [Gemmataceae bacterium]